MEDWKALIAWCALLINKLDLLTSVTHEFKFYGTSRSVGVLKICLHLGLGIGLRGKLE